MRVPPIHVNHPEVRVIQPTWHCLLRFRQRGRAPTGTQAALDALAQALGEASIDAWPPPWAAGQEAPRWAVSDGLAFPLVPAGSPGVWSAATCLRRRR